MDTKFAFGVVYLVIISIITSSALPKPFSFFHHSHTDNKSHHLTVGNRASHDDMVLQQSIEKSSSWMKVQVIEQTFNISKGKNITQIQVLDQKCNGHGAYVDVLSGGPGTDNVTLKFKSERGHGIHFTVLIYAKS